MREVLFRGKDKDSGKWIEGQYVFTNWSGKKRHYIIPEIARDFFIPDFKKDGFYGVEVLPETVGEYTGLVDKNGNKIFEGDIVRFHPHEVCEAVGYISWNKNISKFCIYLFYRTYPFNLERYHDDAEVDLILREMQLMNRKKLKVLEEIKNES